MEEPIKKEGINPSLKSLLKSFLRLKCIWLIGLGIFMIAMSSFLVWVTVTVSVPLIDFIPEYNLITITGYDVSWNLWFGSLTILRMVYFQLACLGLALAALLLRSTFASETPKWIRGAILIISGILGLMVPAYFIYMSLSQVQQVGSQFQGLQWIIDIVKNYVQVNLSVGLGLILALIGPILLLISSVFVFREKS